MSSTISIISEKVLAIVEKRPGPNCQKQCRDISIEYSFGIGADCYLDNSYSIICKNSCNSSRPFMESINLEVVNLSVQESQVKVNSVVLSSCKGNGSTTSTPADIVVDLSDVPFWFSGISNRFTVVGCNNLAFLTNDYDDMVVDCMSCL